MAGGTGGHVFPALALARELRTRSWQIVWLGTRRGLEARVVPAENIPVEWLEHRGLRGKGLLAWLLAPLRLGRSLFEALAVMRRHRPSVVVGLGGYVTGPGGVAAWLTRAPLLIHEQNAIAGFTNRCLARLAREVYAAFPDAFGSGVAAQRDRQSGARRDRRDPAAGRAFRATERCDPHPRRRRQPGRGAAEHGAAVRAGAARRPHQRRRAPSVRRTLDRSCAPRLRSRRRQGAGVAVHRGHGRQPTAGRIWSSAAPAR